MKITAPHITKAKWSSEKAFILATLAAAVGLGNFWRFPYLVGENGGAAFIVAYLIAVVAIGIPIMLVEFKAGSAGTGGVVKSFRTVHKHAAWFGWLVVLLTFVILTYYLVITGWTLGYAVESLSGGVRSFDDFTSNLTPVFYFLVVAVITALVVLRGVKFIEVLARWLVPVLLVIILLLTAYSLTLGGTGEAIGFLFQLDPSNLASPSLWAVAFGQAFYSLAIGQGYLLTYGGFLPDKVNLPRATGIIAAGETSVALIAGLMIFPIVFTFGLNPAEGTELAFETLPVAFGNIPIGWILSILFFWLLFLAAISSCIASMEVIKRAVEEEFRLRSLWATIVIFVPLVLIGLLSAVSFTPLEIQIGDYNFLEVLDLFTANQVVILSGVVGAAIIGWVTPKQSFTKLFGRRFKWVAAHVINVARYGWMIVLSVLLISLVM